MRELDDEQRHAGNRRESDEQSIEAVDEIDRVHQHQIPQQRQRRAQPQRKLDVVASVQRIVQPLDVEAVEQ